MPSSISCAKHHQNSSIMLISRLISIISWTGYCSLSGIACLILVYDTWKFCRILSRFQICSNKYQFHNNKNLIFFTPCKFMQIRWLNRLSQWMLRENLVIGRALLMLPIIYTTTVRLKIGQWSAHCLLVAKSVIWHFMVSLTFIGLQGPKGVFFLKFIALQTKKLVEILQTWVMKTDHKWST